MDNKELVIVVDFGGQYNQLIARRVRENHVYCEVYPYHKAVSKIKELQPQGIIFTGGPASVYEENAPKKKKCSIWEFLYWAFAMACSSWRKPWAGKSSMPTCVNLARRQLMSIRHPLCLKDCRKKKLSG